MNNELNTLLTTLYVFLDDTVLPRLGVSGRHVRGRKPELSDAELLCLVVAQQLLQFDSETRWVRYARTHLREMFPAMLGQSGYNKRVRAAGPLIARVITELARDTPSWHDILRLVDSTPVPAGASRETVKRSDLAGDAGYGYCASHSRFFWGFRLYLVSTPDGMPVLWALANPKLGEREVLRAMLGHDHHLLRDGQVFIADKGFSGQDFEAFITDQLGAHTSSALTAKTNGLASASSAASVNGSSPFLTPSRASSTSNAMPPVHSTVSTPASAPGSSRSPLPFGITGASTPLANAPSSPTTINPIRN